MPCGILLLGGRYYSKTFEWGLMRVEMNADRWPAGDQPFGCCLKGFLSTRLAQLFDETDVISRGCLVLKGFCNRVSSQVSLTKAV